MRAYAWVKASGLAAGDHFWYRGKFYLAHKVEETAAGVIVWTGRSTLLVRPETTVQRAEP